MDSGAATELLAAAREMLSVLWVRAMRNDSTDEELRALKLGCMAIAIADRGEERVMPFANWRDS
jgi:hypothetical protein